MPKDQKINPNTIVGGVYTVTPAFGKKFMQCENKRKFDGVKIDDIVSKHSEIYGHWAYDLFING